MSLNQRGKIFSLYLIIQFGCGSIWSSSMPTNPNGDLVINVGYTSPDDESPTSIYRQVITGNSSTDTVAIEFTEIDGTLVTQLTDFRMQSQIMRVIILGEEELSQPMFQVLCFVSYFKGDLIPPEAVMKLRQKHPGALRTAEDDMGDIVQDLPLRITPSVSKLTAISSHLPSLCKDARTTSYTSTQDLQNILNAGSNQVDRLGNNIKPTSIGSLTKNVQGYDSLPSCFHLSPFNKGNDENRYNVDDEQDEDNEPNKDVQCLCSRKVFLNWYPCALKYCQNKDGDGEHRCGIRTCKKIITYQWPSTLRFCTTIEADEV